MSFSKYSYITVFTLLLLMQQVAISCPVCFGLADAKTAEANNNAILFLLSVTGVVLSSVGAFCIYMWRRIRRLRKEQVSEAAFVSEHGNLILHNEEGVTEEWNNT